MTVHPLPADALMPSDDDRDEALARLGWTRHHIPHDLGQLERITALRDSANEFGAALQAYVPAGVDREQAWILFEDAVFRATHGIIPAPDAQEA